MELNKYLFYEKTLLLIFLINHWLDSTIKWTQKSTKNSFKRIKVKQNNELIEESIHLRNGFKSDSFNRFGDNLFEVVLNYFPLKEKVIITSVNKQFNRIFGFLNRISLF
jgi:hypothetical protein